MRFDFSYLTSKNAQRGLSRRQAGFTLLLAAIIASIAIALGAAIYDIAQKQVTLSSTAKQSQYAFYTADTAAECALYWDIRCSYFATSTPTSCGTITLPPTCDGQQITPLTVAGNPPNYPYSDSFQFELSQPGNPSRCAHVTVKKSAINTNGQVSIHTSIQADGYNVSCTNTTANPALERSVELDY